jgi:hypothetical protein
MAREIPPQYVAHVDRDIMVGRANLKIHLAEFRKYLDEGDAPETVAAGFAQHMLRHKPGAHHLALMLAIAVLTLVEKERETDPVDGFTLGARRIGTTFVIEQTHEACGARWAVSSDDGITQAHLRVMAEDHLRGCEVPR